MKEKPSSSSVPEKKIREITEAAENGNYGVLTKFLNNLSSSKERIATLQRIEKTNQENRLKSGKPPRLAFVRNTYADSDFVDVALMKKSSDWLFQDDVLYRESLICHLAYPALVHTHH